MRAYDPGPLCQTPPVSLAPRGVHSLLSGRFWGSVYLYTKEKAAREGGLLRILVGLKLSVRRRDRSDLAGKCGAHQGLVEATFCRRSVR